VTLRTHNITAIADLVGRELFGTLWWGLLTPAVATPLSQDALILRITDTDIFSIAKIFIRQLTMIALG
jgi:hypothetical protein